jgi:hypothetical protein
MLTVACFKWFDPRGRYNHDFIYTAEHVNRLKRMVDRHLSIPHQFTCIADDPAGLAPDIRFVPIDEELLRKAGRRYPKLMIFRPDAADWLGDRILLLDLDTLIVGSLDPLVDRDEDFVAWEDPKWGRRAGVGKFNSSMVLLRAGSHPEVWTSFQSASSHQIAGADPSFSDQAWIWQVLGEDHPVWTRKDGVLSFKRHLMRRNPFTLKRDIRRSTALPAGARVVFFHGGIDPDRAEFQRDHPWVQNHIC